MPDADSTSPDPGRARRGTLCGMPQPPEPRFLDDRLAYWAEHKPDGEAISYLNRSWTWSQWNDRVRRLAGALAARGIGRGDVVSFLDTNHPACVETTLAAATLVSLLVGQILRSVRPDLDRRRFERLLARQS